MVDLPCVVVWLHIRLLWLAFGYVAFSYAAGMGCTWDVLKKDAV